MAKIMKIVGIVAAALAGLLILAVITANLIPGKHYKSLIASLVKSATGRELAIEGDLDIKILSTFTFKASHVKFTNANWGSRPHMMTVKQMAGEFALFPLLKGILDVSLVIDSPDLLIETHGSGQGNWQFGELAEEIAEAAKVAGKVAEAQKKAQSGKGGTLRPRIRKLQFNLTRIAYIDGKSGNQIDIDIEKLLVGITKDGLIIEAAGKFNGIPLALSGRCDNSEFIIDNQPANVKLDGHFGDAKLAVRGTAGPLAPTFDLDVTVDMDTPTVAALSPLAGRELPDIGPLAVSAKLTGKEGKYAVSAMRITLDHKILTAEVKGSVADLATLDGLNLEARADTDHLTEFLKGIGYQPGYKLPDSLNVMVVAEGSLKDLAIKQFQAKIRGQGLNATASGVVQNIIALEGVRADVSLETESLAIISEITKTQLPPLAPLKVTASVVSKGPEMNLMEITANITGKMVHANVTGSVQDPFKTKTINADIELGIESLAWVSDYLKTELSPLNSLKASAGIVSKGDRFEIRNLKADIAGEGVKATVSGSMGDMIKLKEINANIDIDLESLAILSKIAKTELPSLGPLSVSAGIASKGETFEVKGIKANLAGEKIQAKVAGSVKDVLKLTGINADINLAVDSLASLDPIVKQKLPVSGPATLVGKISGEGGLKAPVSITAILKSEGVTVNVSGNIAEPLAAEGIAMALVAEADSMRKMGKLTGIPFQSQEPMKLESKITTGENAYELAGLHLQIGELDIKGQAAFKQPAETGGRPQVSGKLHIGELDLSKHQERAETAADTDSSPESKKEKEAVEEKKVKKNNIFSSEPLPFGPLRSVDADIEVTVASLTTLQLQLEDLVASLTLDNGLLNLKPIRAKIGNGAFDGHVTLDAGNSPATLTADVKMTDATFRNFGGKIRFLADIEGRGDSVAAIMADLNGLLKLEIRDAKLKKSFMTGFGAGLLDSLNPFKKNEETTELICAIIFFNIKDGIADAHRKIAAQMTDVTWFGSGEIDLKTEEIDFGMIPKPRKGLGISLGSLAKLVHVGGTLAEPRIKLDPKDLAIKSGKIAAALATGGITMLVDLLWSKIKSNSDVCARILEKIEKSMAKETEEKVKPENKN